MSEAATEAVAAELWATLAAPTAPDSWREQRHYWRAVADRVLTVARPAIAAERDGCA